MASNMFTLTFTFTFTFTMVHMHMQVRSVIAELKMNKVNGRHMDRRYIMMYPEKECCTGRGPVSQKGSGGPRAWTDIDSSTVCITIHIDASNFRKLLWSPITASTCQGRACMHACRCVNHRQSHASPAHVCAANFNTGKYMTQSQAGIDRC